jgi:hypothetical protein
MRTAISGTSSQELLNKVEKHYNVESVSVNGDVYKIAKETYNYDDVDNVVFDGCVLDCLLNEDDIHPLDEQIALCSLTNLDVVYVYTKDMTDEEISKYHQFDEFYPGKIINVIDVDTFVIN